MLGADSFCPLPRSYNMAPAASSTGGSSSSSRFVQVAAKMAPQIVSSVPNCRRPKSSRLHPIDTIGGYQIMESCYTSEAANGHHARHQQQPRRLPSGGEQVLLLVEDQNIEGAGLHVVGRRLPSKSAPLSHSATSMDYNLEQRQQRRQHHHHKLEQFESALISPLSGGQPHDQEYPMAPISGRRSHRAACPQKGDKQARLRTPVGAPAIQLSGFETVQQLEDLRAQQLLAVNENLMREKKIKTKQLAARRAASGGAGGGAAAAAMPPAVAPLEAYAFGQQPASQRMQPMEPRPAPPDTCFCCCCLSLERRGRSRRPSGNGIAADAAALRRQDNQVDATSNRWPSGVDFAKEHYYYASRGGLSQCRDDQLEPSCCKLAAADASNRLHLLANKQQYQHHGLAPNCINAGQQHLSGPHKHHRHEHQSHNSCQANYDELVVSKAAAFGGRHAGHRSQSCHERRASLATGDDSRPRLAGYKRGPCNDELQVAPTGFHLDSAQCQAGLERLRSRPRESFSRSEFEIAHQESNNSNNNNNNNNNLKLEQQPTLMRVYDSLAAELKAKLGDPEIGPILLPPKDYDTLSRRQGKLSEIDQRRSTNPQLVGPKAAKTSSSPSSSPASAPTGAASSSSKLMQIQEGQQVPASSHFEQHSNPLKQTMSQQSEDGTRLVKSGQSSARSSGRSSESQSAVSSRRSRSNSSSGLGSISVAEPSCASSSSSAGSHYGSARDQQQCSPNGSSDSGNIEPFEPDSSASSASSRSRDEPNNASRLARYKQLDQSAKLTDNIKSTQRNSTDSQQQQQQQQQQAKKKSNGGLCNGRVEVPLKVNANKNTGQTYLATKQIIY